MNLYKYFWGLISKGLIPKHLRIATHIVNDMARVLSTKEFDTWERLLLKDLQKEVEEFIKELKKGSKAGQPLGYPFFREKRIDGKRIYFLVYEDVDTVLLVTISDKKMQQDTIDKIKKDIAHYRELIRKSF